MKTLGISDAHGWARFVAAQYPYSLVMREIEPEFVDLALNEGIGIVPWGPLGGGFLTGKHQAGHKATQGTRLALMEDEAEHSWVRRNVARNWAILDAVRSIADAAVKTLPQVALAWVAGRPGVVSTLIGARTMEQLGRQPGLRWMAAQQRGRSPSWTQPAPWSPATRSGTWHASPARSGFEPRF